MARKQFERQGIRSPSGGLATGVEFVVYSDEAATVLADISATSGGSSIAGSTVTVGEIVGLGPASLRFWGPTDDTAVLYLRCPAAPSLGIQEVEAEPEGGGGGVTDHGALTGLADDDHPHYATDTDLSTHAGGADPHTGYVLESDHTSAAHDTLGLVTDAILAAHDADTTSVHGIADTSALATTSGVTSAVSTHAGLTDPHTGYVLESLYDAKGDLLPGSADNTPAKLTAGANDTVLTADSTTGTGLKWAAPAVTAHPDLATHDGLGLATDAELSTHAGAADPHAGYVLESDHTSAAHDTLGLVTDAILAAHDADTTAIHGIADTSALATTSEVTSAVSTHAGLTDPHTGYVLESLYDAKGDLLAASADNTPAKLAVGSDGQHPEADSSQATGLRWTSTERLLPVSAPSAPASGAILYVDSGDSKLKAVMANADIVVIN